MLKTYECEKNEKLKLFNIIKICSVIDLDGDDMQRLEGQIEKLQERKKLLKIREDQRIFEENEELFEFDEEEAARLMAGSESK